MKVRNAAALLVIVTLVGVPAAANAGVQPLSSHDTGSIVTRNQAAADTVEKNIKEAAASGSPAARRELADWNALTAADQLEIGNVAASEDFVLAVATQETDTAALQAISPDLTVTVSTGTEPTSSSALVGAQGVTYYDVTSWWKYTYKVLGVTITSIKETYNYQTNASIVTASYSCQGTSTNYAPTRSLSVIDVSHWKSSGKGYCDIAWRITYALFWIPTPFHNDFTQKMRVNGSSGIESTTFVD